MRPPPPPPVPAGLYDPMGRSYMQEAVDEIVTLLTEEQYRGKMVRPYRRASPRRASPPPRVRHRCLNGTTTS